MLNDDQTEHINRTGRMKSHLCVAVFLLSLYAVAGCAQSLQAPAYRSPQPAPISQAATSRAATAVDSAPARAPGGQWESDRYTDLPIPRNYDFNSDESFIFEQEGMRNADLKYAGPMSIEDIIRFYRDGMPSNGWQFVRMSGVRMKTITFTKGGEMCEIIIMSMGPSEIEQGNDWQTPPQTHLHIKLNAY